jgi:hypothetical protein
MYFKLPASSRISLDVQSSQAVGHTDDIAIWNKPGKGAFCYFKETNLNLVERLR